MVEFLTKNEKPCYGRARFFKNSRNKWKIWALSVVFFIAFIHNTPGQELASKPGYDENMVENGKIAEKIQEFFDQSSKGDKSLKEVIEYLGNQFNVTFIFEEKTLENKFPDLEKLQKGPVEKTLKGLLASFSLEYKKINDNNFIISEKNNNPGGISKVQPGEPSFLTDFSPGAQNENGENISSLQNRAEPLEVLILNQEITVSGQVISQEGDPLPGVNVVVQGTSEGTVTDVQGNYSLRAAGDATLVFSYVGYREQAIPINGRSTINVTMNQAIGQLDEVVVTALGVEREERSLGHSVQNVNGEDLLETREGNVVDNLSGRIAGVSVTSGGTTGSGSRLTIRGSSSLTGSNEPLVVVDGVPLAHNNSANSNGRAGLSEINPDNIENISVLKGPNAAALYGSRAANGVIMVTTKSGRESEGLGVTFNSNATFGEPLVKPDFQNIYGGGSGYKTWFADGKNGTVDGVTGTAGVDESWGAPMDGREVPLWWSNGERIPLEPRPNNWEEFWNTSHQVTNNIAISGGNEEGNFRLSVGRMDQLGILPGDTYDRNNLRLNSGYNFTENFNVKLSAEYIKSGGNNKNAVTQRFMWAHRHVNHKKLKQLDVYTPENVIQPEGEYYPYGNWQYQFFYNPFATQIRWPNLNFKDRLLGNISLNYDITDNLKFMVRSGTDFWTNTRRSIGPEKGARYSPDGGYGESESKRQETNSDFLFTYDNQFDNEFSLTANFGGSHRNNYYKSMNTSLNAITVDKLWNLGNNATPPNVSSRIEEYIVNSMYGSATLGFRNSIFLEVTGRNDWSSTLPEDNNSFFYPSASLSGILTDILDVQSSVLSYLKVRGSLAQVGSSADPYQLQQTFNARALWDGSIPSFSESNNIPNYNLKPEITTSREYGLDVRFLEGRIGADVTYYDQATTNQIVDIEISKSTGYHSRKVNAGEITNKGVEVMLTGTPIHNPSGFSWDLSFNYARNRNQVVELAQGLETYTLNTWYISSEARVGEAYGTFFGRPFERDPNGEIIYENGLPSTASQTEKLGNIQPDWTGGFSTTLSYKGLSARGLIDIKQGGDMFMLGTGIARRTGQYAETAVGREEGVIGDGVKNIGTEENPEYVENDVIVNARSFYYRNHARSFHEAGIFDGSYVKLREASLGYRFPNNLLENVFLTSAKISIVGRNLAIFHKNTPHKDPEADRFGGNQQGFAQGQIPGTRKIGFNLNVSF